MKFNTDKSKVGKFNIWVLPNFRVIQPVVRRERWSRVPPRHRRGKNIDIINDGNYDETLTHKHYFSCFIRNSGAAKTSSVTDRRRSRGMKEFERL